MKRWGVWAAATLPLVGAGVLAGGAISVGDARGRCSDATLRGTYLFAADGVEIGERGHIPIAAAGYERYHGDGNVNAVVSFSVNGEVTRKARVAGSYMVKADCTGRSTYPVLGEHFDIFVAPDGSMFTFLQTDPGSVVAGSEIRGTAKRVD